MKVTYHPHYKVFSEGHLYFDKPGACTVSLMGAASMSQTELDAIGSQVADVLSDKHKGKMEFSLPVYDGEGDMVDRTEVKLSKEDIQKLLDATCALLESNFDIDDFRGVTDALNITSSY